MLKRREAQFRVEHVIFDELPEHISHQHAQTLLRLQQVDDRRHMREKICQIGALFRTGKVAQIVVVRDGWIELCNALITERRIHVQVQFNFGQVIPLHQAGPHSHRRGRQGL